MRFIFFLCVAAISLESSAQNPFITSIYTADPSAHVWKDGRLYVYPSHDIDPARGCDLMDRYHVYSTDDMKNWRDEGEILRASQVPWGRKEGGFMWAPDCAYKNGTYFFYFPHPSGTSWDTTWKVGIATSQRPGSDFTVAGYIEGLRGRSMIDPCVFVDTDGTAYLYYGGGGRCEGAKLKDNMTALADTMQSMKGLVDFHEAAWVFKRNGVYYLTYADNNPKQNQLRYATSTSPMGPWVHKGVFLGVTGCDTNHGSVVEYKGNWYMFYHNQAISNTGKGNLRSICVDQLYFNDDGSIRSVEQTKTGVAAVKSNKVRKPANTKWKRYEAELARVESVSIVENVNASGGKYVTGMDHTQAALRFEKIDGGKKGGRATIHIYHSGNGYARTRLTVNGQDFSLLNHMASGGEADFKGHTYITVRLNAGTENIIELTGGKGVVNLDYVRVELLD